jgi:gas vesicle protein
VSEHESGGGSREGSAFGPFLLGLSLGAVLGFLFAPEPGEVARGRLGRRLRSLRDLAAEKAGEIGDLIQRADEGDEEEPPATTRAALERRLGDAKRRRRGRGASGRGAALPRPDEGDEPVA